MSTVSILPVVRHDYAPERDWLSEGAPRRPPAQVVEFHQKLARCSVCSSPAHRASRCPVRPGKDTTD